MFEQEEQRDELLEKIEDLISRKRYAELRDLLLPLEAQDIAGLFMELDDKVPMVFRLLPKEQAAEVFVELDSEEQEVLIQSFSNTELKEVLDELYLDDTVDIIEDMPANVVSRILRNTDASTRSQINQLLNYPKDSAGSIMTTEFVFLHPDATVEESFARIRSVGIDKETIYTCYVTQNRVLLGVVTVLYCLVSLAAVGAMHWTRFAGTEAALSKVLGGHAGSVLLSVGAVVAVASVVLAVLYGQTRVLFAMSRDGLVPKLFSRVNPRTGVPSANTVVVAGFIAVLAAVVPLGDLADATSIGTLFAFALVNVAVLVLRRTRPDLPRTFRAPFAPVTPILGVASCGWMMASLAAPTWIAFGGWMLVGLVVYFGYGRRHSALAGRCASHVTADK